MIEQAFHLLCVAGLAVIIGYGMIAAFIVGGCIVEALGLQRKERLAQEAARLQKKGQ